MNANVSRAIGTHGATGLPSAEEIEAAALVLSCGVNIEASKLRTLAQAIVRHTRQACHAAEKPLREALDANDIGECRACGRWINRTTDDDLWVDSVGLFCNADCAHSSGEVCICGDRKAVDDATCGDEPCDARFLAEVQQ